MAIIDLSFRVSQRFGRFCDEATCKAAFGAKQRYGHRVWLMNCRSSRPSLPVCAVRGGAGKSEPEVQPGQLIEHGLPV